MATKNTKRLIEIGLFSLTILLVAALLIATAWGAWVMIITWLLNNDGYRIIIIGTSVFWASVGVLAWLIRTNRKI
jgi:hypothetical protein